MAKGAEGITLECHSVVPVWLACRYFANRLKTLPSKCRT